MPHKDPKDGTKKLYSTDGDEMGSITRTHQHIKSKNKAAVNDKGFVYIDGELKTRAQIKDGNSSYLAASGEDIRYNRNDPSTMGGRKPERPVSGGNVAFTGYQPPRTEAQNRAWHDRNQTDNGDYLYREEDESRVLAPRAGGGNGPRVSKEDSNAPNGSESMLDDDPRKEALRNKLKAFRRWRR